MASAAAGGILTFTHTNGRSLARRCSMSRARSPRWGASAAATAPRSEIFAGSAYTDSTGALTASA